MHDTGDAQLIHHLRELPTARFPKQHAGLRVAVDDWLGPLEVLLDATAHNGQYAVFRTGLAARNGRVDEADPFRLRRGVKLAGDIGGSGCVVNEHGAFRHPGKGAVLAQHDAAQIIVIADAAEDHLGTLCRFAGRLGDLAAMLLLPFGSAGCCAVIDGHLMSARFQMSRHRIAHHAEADPRYFRHVTHSLF